MSTNSKVLVIDDDPDVVSSLRMMLEGAGYDVSEAGDADEGLTRLQEVEPDLIVLDIMMPEGTEGFHFVWTVRNEQPEPLCDVPIVVLSSIHDQTNLTFYPEESNGTYEPGEFLPVQEFIDKPVEPSVLLQTVEEQLELTK